MPRPSLLPLAEVFASPQPSALLLGSVPRRRTCSSPRVRTRTPPDPRSACWDIEHCQRRYHSFRDPDPLRVSLNCTWAAMDTSWRRLVRQRTALTTRSSSAHTLRDLNKQVRPPYICPWCCRYQKLPTDAVCCAFISGQRVNEPGAAHARRVCVRRSSRERVRGARQSSPWTWAWRASPRRSRRS